MEINEAHELIDTEPRFDSRWSAGVSCSTCGTLVVSDSQEQAKHARWHAALAAVLGPPESKFIV